MKGLKKILILLCQAMLFFPPMFSCISEKHQEGSLRIPFHNYYPPQLADGWAVAEAADVRINGEALRDAYRYIHEAPDMWQIRSLLVVRNNKLVAESYTKDPGDRNTPAAVWSCTKQITAILTGIAVDKGLISVADPVSKYFPQAASSPLAEITIENLLTMKSGINFSNDGFSGEVSMLLRREPSNSLDFIFGLGMRSSPGTRWYYNDGDPIVISAIIQKQTGRTLRDWAGEVL